MKKFIPLLIVVIAAAGAITTQAANGLLSKEPPDVIINGPPVNFTADQQDIDIQIDPSDALPANGTVSISTLGATDSDMNGFPPLGVSVIIENQSVTVTNQPITLGNPAPAPSTGDGDGGDEGGD
jgi:hypothetical protein